MNQQEKNEAVKRCKENRRNINFVNSNLNPYSYIKKDLRLNKLTLNDIIDELEDPVTPPPVKHICKNPLPEVGKVNGWSGFGYEGLTYKEVEDFITAELFDAAADLLAKNRVNLHRFFAFVTGDNYTKDCVQVFPKYSDGYNMEEIDDDYVSIVAPRLGSFEDRKMSAMVCMGSGVKNIAGRWSENPMNGKNNSNGTTEDHVRFYDDAEMKKGDLKTRGYFRT